MDDELITSNHRAGVILSWVGVILVILVLACLVIPAIGFSAITAAGENGTPSSSFDSERGWYGILLGVIPGVLLLFATCCLIPGEQLRRGRIRQKTQGDLHTSRFRVLGFGWHALWAVLGLLVSVALLGIPFTAWFTGGWPETLDDAQTLEVGWVIYGALGFALSVAAFVSLVKKAAYFSAVRRGLAPASHPSAFWRFVDFRMRFDLWVAGIGGLAVAFSVTFLNGFVGPDGYGSLTGPLIAMFVTAGIGVILIVLGVIASLQFWRSGQNLGSGESAY